MPANSERDRIYKFNVVLALIFRPFATIAGFLTVPLVLGYVDTAAFGLWLVISSVMSWLNSMDMGLGNGLRNRLAESFANNDYRLAKQYISTVYFIIALISLGFLIIFFIVDQFVSWAALFKAPIDLSSELNQSVILCALFFSFKFILNLIVSILRADQKIGLTQIFGSAATILVLVSVFLLKRYTQPSFFLLCLAMVAPHVVLVFCLNTYLFLKNYSNIRPSLSAIRWTLLNDVASLGIKFFLMQVLLIIVFATDNIIITRLFGPEKVTPYNIALRYMSIGIYLFNIVITPAWSAFTEAQAQNDIQWIVKTIRKLRNLWIISIFGLITLVLISPWAYQIWIGDRVKIPITLTILMAIYTAQNSWNRIYANYINGVGKIDLLLRISIFVGIANIPLSVFLAKYMKMGIHGVITATIICLLLGSIFAPLQTRLLIKGKAKGIWNR